MVYADKMQNIHVLDTKMFGFDRYMSAYIVEGEEIALIDTCVPKSWEVLRSAIISRGFSLSDITRIFITHEHPDHLGAVSKLLEENSRAKVYINPVAEEALTRPADIRNKKSGQFDRVAQVFEKFNELGGLMEPTPVSRICHLHDGDIFELGNGESLEVIFTPGHLPGGITLLERKNNGMFINDLVGNYFADADAQLILFPMGSDLKKSIESMKKVINRDVDYLYLGHYGLFNNNIRQFMTDTLDKMYRLMDIGTTCMKENRPELIGMKIQEMAMPYIEKMRKARGEALYNYIIQMHLPSIIESFTQYSRRELV